MKQLNKDQHAHLFRCSNESIAILQCVVTNWCPMNLSIDPGIMLIEDNGKISRLLYAYNIPIDINAKRVGAGYKFILLFEGLSESCKCFDFFEPGPLDTALKVRNIKRTGSGVYKIDIEDPPFYEL
jgi:hypothetical protein